MWGLRADTWGPPAASAKTTVKTSQGICPVSKVEGEMISGFAV